MVSDRASNYFVTWEDDLVPGSIPGDSVSFPVFCELLVKMQKMGKFLCFICLHIDSFRVYQPKRKVFPEIQPSSACAQFKLNFNLLIISICYIPFHVLLSYVKFHSVYSENTTQKIIILGIPFFLHPAFKGTLLH
jgi:hypothetical protein